MAVKKNINEKKKSKEKKGWNLKVEIEEYKEAKMLAETEKLPLPDENFDDYPAFIEIPKKFSLLKVLHKAIQYSAMGIYSKAYKD